MVLSAPPRRQVCRSLSPLRSQEQGLSVHRLNSDRAWDRAEVLVRWQRGRFRWLGRAAAGAVLLGFSVSAQASLGGNVSSVESDRAHMSASVQVMQHDIYNVHELQASGGTVVDEYVSLEGKVFAVTWHGQFPPPMEEILGTYFHQYRAALQVQPKRYGHHPLNIEQPGLVVQTGGHMRAYFGRAYIPDLLPEGMKASQLP